MWDHERTERDKATIIAIVKYILISLITILFIYLGFRVIIILLPFVFGFIFARLSMAIVTSIRNTVYDLKTRRFLKWLRERFRRRRAGDDRFAAKPNGLLLSRRKLGRYPQGLARSRGEKRAIIAVYVLIIVLICALFIGVILVGVNQLRTLATYLPDLFRTTDLFQRIVNYIEELSERLGGILQPEQITLIEQSLTDLQQRILQSLPGIATAILNGIGTFAGSLPVVLFVLIVVVMSGYYFIADSRSIYVFLRRNVTNKPFREKSVRLINTLFTTLFRVIGGYVLLLLITFLMALIGLTIIRMPYAVILALVAAVVDFLPILGLSATLIPIALYLFINGNILGGIGALIVLAVMTLIRRVIEPPILGNAMRLHPMATLASMIVGVAIYGIAGLLFGPLILVIGKEILTLYGIDKKLRTFIGDIMHKIGN
jgi:sporulation integral membrane protein YtvI